MEGVLDEGDGTNPVQVRTLDGLAVVWKREVVETGQWVVS